jgi:hypothetical protein
MTGSTVLTDDGAWTWFNDPRAIFHDGQILTGWVNRRGDIQFASHDLASGRTTVLMLHPAFQADDHDNPALLKNPDGTITAFFARHGGDEVYAADLTRGRDGTWTAGDARTISKHPYDPSGDWGWAYANPFRLAKDSSIGLASRGPNFNPVLRIHRDGAWRAATNLVINPGARPYVKYHSDGVERIGFAYTDAHPLGHTNNVYYAYLTDGVYRRADGTTIKSMDDGPLTIGDSQSAIVFDHAADPSVTGDNSWVWDVATDPRTGHPVVAFATFPSTAAHQYHVARFDGTRWIDRILVDNAGGTITSSDDEAHYSGGMALDPIDPSVVYVSRQTGERRWDLQQFKTRDDGATWSATTIAGDAAVKSIRPFVPRDRPPDLEMVLWLSGEYGYWDPSRNGGYRTGVRLWTQPSPFLRS